VPNRPGAAGEPGINPRSRDFEPADLPVAVGARVLALDEGNADHPAASVSA